MLYTIENDYIHVDVDTHGAQIMSIYDKTLSREFLWQGAAEAWSNRCLLLFPATGRIDRNRITIDGKEYPMAMHGFAKDMDFSLKQYSNNSIILELEDNSTTRKIFPNKFVLQIVLSLDKRRLVEHVKVRNQGDTDMYFSIGLHPGFFCPIDISESADMYSLVFDQPQNINKIVLEKNTRLCTRENEILLKDEKEIKLSETYFDDGPILIEGVTAKWVALKSNESNIYLKMGIDQFPYMTLWGVPHRMSLICIEPWCGISDYSGTNHNWSSKVGNNCLKPNSLFEREIWFEAGIGKT